MTSVCLVEKEPSTRVLQCKNITSEWNVGKRSNISAELGHQEVTPFWNWVPISQATVASVCVVWETKGGGPEGSKPRQGRIPPVCIGLLPHWSFSFHACFTSSGRINRQHWAYVMNFKYSLHRLKPPFDILGEESFVGAVLACAHLSHNSKFHRPKDHLTHSLPYNVLQRSDPSKHSVQRKTIDHGMRSSMLPSVVLSFCWHPALCIVNCLQLAELALCLSCLVLLCHPINCLFWLTCCWPGEPF